MWDLTAVTCDDGSDAGAIEVSPGETVTCTFTNTKRSVLVVVKESIPDDPQDFDFTISGTEFDGTMILDDDDDATLPKSSSVVVVGGPYTVVESDPGPAWDPRGVECTDSRGSSIGSTNVAGRSASVDIPAGDTVTCVFTDVKRGKIIVEKYVVHEYTGEGFNPRDYPFDFDPSWGPGFSLKHGEVHDTDWIAGGETHTVTENPPSGWHVSSECTYADGTIQTGGRSVSIELNAGEGVHCVFTNELSIYSGSSGFWKNWSNHFSMEQYLLILRESLDDSLVYIDLFDADGDLIDGTYDIIMSLYDNGGASNEQQLVRELTTAFLNIGVTVEPELRGWRQGDGLCLDCEVKADEVPGAVELLERLAPCPAGDGVWRVQDVVDVVEAAWNGDMSVRDYSMSLTSSELGILTSLADGINDGRYMKVDASGYPDDLKCLSVPGPVTATFFRDNDHDGYGIFDDRLQVCDGSAPEGWAPLFGDCNDDEPLSNPGLPESPCDGIDNNCDGIVDPEQDDADGDGVVDPCDAYPTDPDRSGPLHVGTASGLDDLWQSVEFPVAYQNPVVIVGLPTYNGTDPGVVQLHGIHAEGFDIRFREWNYLDGIHRVPESVSYIVMESGRYAMPDGSIWEFGTFDIMINGDFRLQRFPTPFPDAPALFLAAQTMNYSDPFVPRARDVASDGFLVSLFEEEALMNGHAPEIVGYLAIHNPAGLAGSVPVGGVDLPYLLQPSRIGHDFTPVLSWTVKAHEEQSLDDETTHLKENVDILALGNHIFGQDVSVRGPDVHTLRRLDPESSVAMEWGNVDGVGDKWITVPLAKRYDDPVVVAKLASSRDMDPGTVRVRNIGNDSFEVRFEEWSYLDGVHSGEQIFYMVAEKGQHELAGLTVEAGSVVTDATFNAGVWQRVDLTAPFVDAPALFTSVQTQVDSAPVTTRINRRTSIGFRVALQEEEASIVDARAAESVGWIAVEMGTGVSADGRLIEILSSTAGDEYSTTQFTPSTARAYRTVVADMANIHGGDPATIRHAALSRNRVSLVVQEETSMDAETNHVDEEVCLFVAE